MQRRTQDASFGIVDFITNNTHRISPAGLGSFPIYHLSTPTNDIRMNTSCMYFIQI